MNKKRFEPHQIRQLTAERPPPPRSQEQLLCDSIVFFAVVDLFASRLSYARYVPFGDFIDDVEPPSTDVVASLCVFAKDDHVWSPAAVVNCVPDGAPGGAGGKTQHFLESVGIAYVVVTPPQVASGYTRTPEFRGVLTRAVAGDARISSTTEEFQSEPRPLYPPRRGVVGN